MRNFGRIILAILTTTALAGAAPAQIDLPEKLPPLTEIPPLQTTWDVRHAQELAARAEVREYRRQVREIQHRYFRAEHNEDLRKKGIEQIREFTDPAAYIPLIDELSDEKDDVRLAMLDHFAEQDEWGQAALAWITIHTKDSAMHYEALQRLTRPASDAVLSVVDQGLRSSDDFAANLAGRLAGHLEIYEAIPLLIHTQAAQTAVEETGDQAWILVGRQKVFIQALIPVVGDASGAFLPVLGVLTEGVILRINEAFAVIYRTEIHHTLVAMTTNEWGRSTAHLGYDVDAWRAWYEDEYVPYRKEEALIDRLAREAHEKSPPERNSDEEDDEDAGDGDGNGG